MSNVTPLFDSPNTQSLIACGIPDYMHEGILNYVENRVKPGHFLTAIITNDLRNAVFHADSTNLNLIKNYVQWFYNHPPSPCWGSVEKMEAWLAGE